MPSTAYLLLARHFDGRPLELTIASVQDLASYGPFQWERAPKPYAEVTADTLDDAHSMLLRKLVADPEPWPDALVPLVEDLLKVQRGDRHGGSPFRRPAAEPDTDKPEPVAFDSSKGRSRRGRIHNRIRFLTEQCTGGVAKGEASALRWILELCKQLSRRVANLEAQVTDLDAKRLAEVRAAETRGHQLEAANREIVTLRAAIDPAIRKACGCCRKCGPTVPCTEAIESLGETCEGRCYCGVEGQLDLQGNRPEEPCES